MPLRAAVRKESPRRLNLSRFEKAVSRVLKEVGWKNAEISILLTTDRKIKKVHKDYFKDDTPTDVISFGQDAKISAQKSKGPVFIGDLVISLDTAARECAKYGNTFSYEVLFYTVHGILHCMGHDDDTPAKSKLMLKMQALILKRAGLADYSLVN